MNVSLTGPEYEILQRLSGNRLPESGNSPINLDISDNLADTLRDLCGDELQIHGFDENYEPTTLGKILESLIDKLYVG